MRAFEYGHAHDLADAIGTGAHQGAKFIAGGTNLVDLMKAGVETPSHLIDLNALALSSITHEKAGVRIGALARMSDVAADPLIRIGFKAVAEALLASASPQLRNAASLGGNLMQRTRCPYFRELLWTPCNKREPGSGCSAVHGDNRLQAVLGTSEHCIALSQSDFAVAFAALDGVLELHGPEGRREVAATDFHLQPGSTPQREHDLRHGEMITSLFLPNAPHASRSAYLKVRDRTSYEFALASAAVGLDLDGRTVPSARIALGGVATKPWRSREAEATLIGKQATEEVFRTAAAVAMKGAAGHGENDYKIELGRRTVIRALTDLAGGVA